MPANSVRINEVYKERAALKRHVPPRLEALQKAFRQLEELDKLSPTERDREFILLNARRMLAELEARYKNVAVTQIDMGLF
jgi:hypothetical protein